MANSPLTTRVIYSDIFTDFDAHPITRQVLRKTNVDAVKQSIKNIILTDRGERLFNPDFGGNIRALLFENATPHSILTVREMLMSAIETYEPRADIIDVVIATTSQEHTVNVSVVFKVINVKDPITLDVVLERVR